MHIGIAGYLAHAGAGYRAAGLSVYTSRLIEHLPATAPEHAFTAFVGRDAPPFPTSLHRVESPVPTAHPLVRIVWEQTGLPLQSVLARLDLLHATVNVLPLVGRTPAVVTVHDLAFLRYPETFPPTKARYLRAMVGRSARAARRVIAVSGHTRSDLIELAGVPEERIEVVYSGIDPRFRPLAPEKSDGFRRTVFGGRPYILHVGTLQPRKRIDLLIRAFADLRGRAKVPHVLALVGARGWMYAELHALVDTLGVREHVHFAEYVPDEGLPLWYNCAEVFAYPSVYEGFGLPVLEAMACGTPVLTSRSSSLLEIAGDAAMTVEPDSVESLTEGLAAILAHEDRRTRMIDAGLKRAAGFTWPATARVTVGVYERAFLDQ